MASDDNVHLYVRRSVANIDAHSLQYEASDQQSGKTLWPFDAHCCHMGTAFCARPG